MLTSVVVRFSRFHAEEVPFRSYHMVSAGFAKTRVRDEVKIAHVLYRSLEQVIGPGTDRDG